MAHSAVAQMGRYRPLFVACVLLATGSSTLLLAMMIVTLLRYSWGGFYIVMLAASFAMFAHVVAWAYLASATKGSRVLTSLFLASVGIYAVMVPLVVWSNFTLPSYWANHNTLGVFLLSPYMPSIFSPVVIVHAALFLIIGRSLPSSLRRFLVASGLASSWALQSSDWLTRRPGFGPETPDPCSSSGQASPRSATRSQRPVGSPPPVPGPFEDRRVL